MRFEPFPVVGVDLFQFRVVLGFLFFVGTAQRLHDFGGSFGVLSVKPNYL